MKKYNLFFEDQNQNQYCHFSNVNLKTIDEFTSTFFDLEDLVTIIGAAQNIPLTKAYILDNSPWLNPYPIMYQQDTYKEDDLFIKYYSYIRENLERIKQSPLRYLPMYEIKDYLAGRTHHISDKTLKSAIKALFQTYSHRRQAYFTLKAQNIKVQKESPSTFQPSSHHHSSISNRPRTNDDDELQTLLNNDNYDELLTLYDVEYLNQHGVHLTDTSQRRKNR